MLKQEFLSTDFKIPTDILNIRIGIPVTPCKNKITKDIIQLVNSLQNTHSTVTAVLFYLLSGEAILLRIERVLLRD